MKKVECCILVFAKAPIEGLVKTRLHSSMTSDKIISFYKNLILYTLKKTTGSCIGSVELWCTPSIDHPFFKQCAESFQIPLFCQPDGDLGKRMAYAINSALHRASFSLLIGTDCPSLTTDDLKEAKESLIQGYQAVFSPAEDGGYVLIGLSQFHPSLFEGISWGSSSVFKETRKRLQKLRWKWKELSERWDVDRPEDLERLKEEGYSFLI